MAPRNGRRPSSPRDARRLLGDGPVCPPPLWVPPPPADGRPAAACRPDRAAARPAARRLEVAAAGLHRLVHALPGGLRIGAAAVLRDAGAGGGEDDADRGLSRTGGGVRGAAPGARRRRTARLAIHPVLLRR